MTLDCAAIGCNNIRLDQEDIASSVAGKQTTAFRRNAVKHLSLQHLLYLVSQSTSELIGNQPLVVPGFPHPVFGDVTILARSVDNDFPAGGLWGWDPALTVPENDRTMFLTFSRGFPVTNEEVTELFTSICGDCVVNVQMQENSQSNEQPLYAKMIMRTVTAVDQVLCGKRVAKFRINGKHIWARKYERRE
nr:uncharacterized protein LOC118050288 isoform X2 [Populus alba]